jgi:hypothetical protein
LPDTFARDQQTVLTILPAASNFHPRLTQPDRLGNAALDTLEPEGSAWSASRSCSTISAFPLLVWTSRVRLPRNALVTFTLTGLPLAAIIGRLRFRSRGWFRPVGADRQSITHPAAASSNHTRRSA